MIIKIIILSVFMFSNFAMAKSESLRVGVRGMVCSFCAQGIEKKFKEQKEVESVEVNLEKKYVDLTFKDGQKLTQDKIANLLKDSGYELVTEGAK